MQPGMAFNHGEQGGHGENAKTRWSVFPVPPVFPVVKVIFLHTASKCSIISCIFDAVHSTSAMAGKNSKSGLSGTAMNPKRR
jgi:hypothetical protein